MFADTITSLIIIAGCFAIAALVITWEGKRFTKPDVEEAKRKASLKLYKMVRRVHRDDDKSVAVFIGGGNRVVPPVTMDRLHALLDRAIGHPFINEFNADLMQVCLVDGWIIRDVHYRRKVNYIFGGNVAYYVRFELQRLGTENALEVHTETVTTPLIPSRCVRTLPVVRGFRSAGDIKL